MMTAHAPKSSSPSFLAMSHREMDEMSSPIGAWLRGSLADRYDGVLWEEIPEDMLAILDEAAARH